MIITLLPMLMLLVFAAQLSYRRADHFVIFLMMAGILQFGANTGDAVAGSGNLSSVWLLGLILLSCVAIARSGALQARFTAPEVCYLFFLGWCVFEGLRTTDTSFAIRGFLKLLYPFLVMVLARHAIRSVPTARLLAMRLMMTAAGAYLLLGGLPSRLYGQIVGPIWGYFWLGAPFSDYAAIMTIVALACWKSFGQRRYLVLAIFLGTASIFVSIRTGILATGVGLCVYMFAQYGRRGVPLLVGVYLATTASLFLLPDVNQKMFSGKHGGSDAMTLILSPGNLSAEGINDSGRFNMWGVVMDRFFWPNPILGSGLGATQAWFYTVHDDSSVGEMKVEHSEYVKLLSDTGIVGLSLFLCSLGLCVRAAWMALRVTREPVIRIFAIGAVAGIPAFLACMAFDNALLYVLPAAQYPFAFTGITLGLIAHSRSRSSLAMTAPRRLGPNRFSQRVAN